VPDPFDPYVEWLGLRTANRSLSYYQLFGLDEFEDDSQRISMAADAMLARVRSVRPGPQRKRWQELLDELLLAKVCLTDASRKAQYDRQLGGERGDIPADRPSTGPSIAAVSQPPVNPDLLPPGMALPAASGAPVDAVPAAAIGRPSAPWATVAQTAPTPHLAAGDANPPGSQRAAAFGNGGPFSNPASAPAAWPGAATATSFSLPQSPAANPAAAAFPSSAASLPSAPGSAFPPPAVGAGPVAMPVAGSAGLAAPGPVANMGPAGAKPTWRPIPVTARDEAALANSPIAVGGRPDSIASAARQDSPSLHVYLAGGLGVLALVVLILIFSKPAADPSDDSGQTASVAPHSTKPAESTPPKDRAAATETRRPPTDDTQAQESAPAAEEPAVEPVKPKRRPKPPAKAATKPPTRPENTAADQAAPVEPAAPRPPAAEAGKNAAFRKTVATARRALADRDVAQAKKALATASGQAQSTEDHEELGRLNLLATYVDGFWNAVRESLNALQAADELKIGGAVAAVVDSDAEGLTVHIGGVNKEFKTRSMPASLAVTLAQRWFNQDAGNKLFLGAFLAVDPQGDKNEARQYWEQATAGGASAQDLMPLLSGGPAAGTATGARKMSAPPNEKQQAAALKHIKEVFQGEYKSAKTPDRKLELSQKLLNTATETDDTAERYALLREAVDLAASGGSPATIAQAVEELARWYKIDPLDVKADGLARAATAATNPLAAKDIARSALDLLDEAIKQKRVKSAGKLSQAATSAARKSKDTELVKAATQRSQQLQELTR
jgi:hypothetical protein